MNQLLGFWLLLVGYQGPRINPSYTHNDLFDMSTIIMCRQGVLSTDGIIPGIEPFF